MAFVVVDRVWETSTTTGTGTYTLAGAKPGDYRTFGDIGDGNSTFYYATDGEDWEVGVGTYTASGTTLARTAILVSSNSNAAVNWSAGTRDIYCTNPAARSFWNLAAGLIKGDGAGQVSAVPISSFAEGLLDDTSAGAMRATLDLEPGTDIMAYDAELAAIAGLTSAADKGVQFTGAGTAGTFDLTAAARDLLDDTSAGAMRTTLELGTAAVANIGVANGNVLGADSIGFDFGDEEVRRPYFKDIAERIQTINHSVSGALEIDVSLGNIVHLNQSANITALSFTGWPASGRWGCCTVIKVKDNNGTPRTIVQPTAGRPAGGTAPDLTQTANSVDILIYSTEDGGTNIPYALCGADFKAP